MNLRYQTAIGTLIQFIWLAILSAPDNIIPIVSTCHSDSSNCVSNLISTLIFYLLTVGWFGMILLLGYLAQHRRSRNIAVLLIGMEFVTLVVSGYIDFPRDTNYLTKFTSLTDAILSIWVIYLSINLIRARGGRVVKKSMRPRNRKPSTS